MLVSHCGVCLAFPTQAVLRHFCEWLEWGLESKDPFPKSQQNFLCLKLYLKEEIALLLMITCNLPCRHSKTGRELQTVPRRSSPCPQQ